MSDRRNLKVQSLNSLNGMSWRHLCETFKDNAEHTQDMDQSNNDSDLGNQVDEAIKSNDESEERLEPPPITSPVRRRRYRPPEVFVPRRSERIRERNKRVDNINQGRL